MTQQIEHVTQAETPEQRMRYIAECIETHAEKFSSPSHMRLHAQFLRDVACTTSAQSRHSELADRLELVTPTEKQSELLHDALVDSFTDFQAPILTALRSPASASPADVEGLVKAAQTLIAQMSGTYKARNGRQMGIEAGDGEKCWIVHSDDIVSLEAALAPFTKEPKA